MNANVKFLHRSTDIRHARLSGWTVDVLLQGEVTVA